MRRTLTLISAFALVLAMLALPAGAETYQPPQDAVTVHWNGNGTDSEACFLAGDDENRTDEGWIHWVLTSGGSGTVVSAKLIVNGKHVGDFYREGQGGGAMHAYTDFYDLDGLEAYAEIVKVDGTVRNIKLVISDYCPGLFGSILIEKTYDYEGVHDDAEFYAKMIEYAVLGDGTLGEEVGEGDRMDFTQYNGLYCLDGLNFGDYRVYEEEPDGFLPKGPWTVTVDEESNCEDRVDAYEAGDADLEILNEAAPVNAVVAKKKLAFEDGEFVPTATPLAGFTFVLYKGADDTGPSTQDYQTQEDGQAGPFIFLEVGETYTICEEATPQYNGEDGYWSEPYKLDEDELVEAACQTFTAEFNKDTELTFYNAPRADISVDFTDVTGFTTAMIACYDGAMEPENLIGRESLSTTGSLDLSKLDLGDYHCKVEIRNGGNGSNGGTNG